MSDADRVELKSTPTPYPIGIDGVQYYGYKG